MRFVETDLPGAYVVECEPISDDRGFFARTWCRDEFADKGLNSNLSQCSVSFNRARGTLRGMHWQAAPYGESKLVRCTRGSIRDVIVDLREDSDSYGRWIAVTLDAQSMRSLYVPEGFAHGFETLEDDTEVLYQISVPYAAGSARGFRWNDDAFDITWLTPNPILSERDRSFPDYPVLLRAGHRPRAL